MPYYLELTSDFLPPTKEEVVDFARDCLSVCLLARLLKRVHGFG